MTETMLGALEERDGDVYMPYDVGHNEWVKVATGMTKLAFIFLVMRLTESEWRAHEPNIDLED
jgi:hypothetical protein